MQLNQLQDELRQLQKADASGQLIDSIAHDLNNLLQGNSVFFHLIMKQSASSGDVETRVNNARKAIKKGAKLANQLLAFSLSQAGSSKALARLALKRHA